MNKVELLEKVNEILIEENYKNHLYVNLSNGAEILPYIGNYNITFLNIQSTQLEQKNYDAVINRLGADFLMKAALGHNMFIVDYGTRKEVPRSLYQGVPFLIYAMERSWFNKKDQKIFIQPRSSNSHPVNVTKDFEYRYNNLSKSTKAYLKKFRDYAKECRFDKEDKNVHIIGLSTATLHDGDKQYYTSAVKTYENICGMVDENNRILDSWDI